MPMRLNALRCAARGPAAQGRDFEALFFTALKGRSSLRYARRSQEALSNQQSAKEKGQKSAEKRSVKRACTILPEKFLSALAGFGLS
jgi:hypothetical protein